MDEGKVQNASEPIRSGVDRRALLSGIAAAPAFAATLLPAAAQAQTPAARGGFSFAACGDSRPMM
jgi:hypothetical protein